MAAKLTKKRAKVLADLEYIVGNNCYNGNIQNHGPGGVYEGAGRDFRYPLSLAMSESLVVKRRSKATEIDFEALMSGYYAFGSNRLSIVDALDKVLKYLEENHGLKI